MFIVLTPFVNNKTDYRLGHIQRNRANDHINLAEPHWYSNLNPRMMGFMYGGHIDKRPDILDLDRIDDLLEYFDDSFLVDTLVHVPIDLYLDVEEIDAIIKDRQFLKFEAQTEDYLQAPFIRFEKQFYRIPEVTVDANDASRHLIKAPLIRFEDDNLAPEINEFLAARQPVSEISHETYLPIAVGGWCGVAEALKWLGLRDEAYPFDYIRCDFRPVVDLLELDQPKRAEVESILFGDDPDGRMEYVHHKTENDDIRELFINRAYRFIERVTNSEKPVWYLRSARDDVELVSEIRQARRLLELSESKFGRKHDRVLLMANYQYLPTGRMSIVRNGTITIWNAMGVNAWKVPNNWHHQSNLAKIIKHELCHADQKSRVHFRKPPDYTRAPLNKTNDQKTPQDAADTNQEQPQASDNTSRVTVHLSDQAPLEIRCDDQSPILNILFQAIYENETNPEKNRSLVHLRVEEGGQFNDVILRSSQICRIEVSPTLNPDAPRNLNRQPLSILARCKRKTRHLLGKLRR